MHIPDGYLSPQTTVAAFAGMIPVWATALHRVKKTQGERQIPALALSAAFSFVIMMFNVPVVGGSSAHAVGAVFIAILLGPWAAVISVSTALLIQALMFGDGGVLAFGVNCINMAVVMPFVGWGVYKLIAGRTRSGGARNAAAAFVGSYAGLNVAALCAGTELGIQPLLFHTAAGLPLYCMYPLWVSVPAMLFAHALFAGPLEGVLTAAGVAYAAKLAPRMFTAKGALPAAAPEIKPEINNEKRNFAGFIKCYRAALIPLGVLALLSPLGLLAGGTAWGEWNTAEIRQRLGYIPAGLAAMTDKWKALLPGYSLPLSGRFGAVAGTVVSAAVGMALIAVVIFLSSRWILRPQKGKKQA